MFGNKKISYNEGFHYTYTAIFHPIHCATTCQTPASETNTNSALNSSQRHSASCIDFNSTQAQSSSSSISHTAPTETSTPVSQIPESGTNSDSEDDELFFKFDAEDEEHFRQEARRRQEEQRRREQFEQALKQCVRPESTPVSSQSPSPVTKEPEKKVDAKTERT